MNLLKRDFDRWLRGELPYKMVDTPFGPKIVLL